MIFYDNRDYYYNPCYPLNYPDGQNCHDNTAAVSLVACQFSRSYKTLL